MAKIVLIEDSPCTSEVFVQSLRREGHSILTASDGMSGIQLIQGERPDLIICDVMIPKLDGYDVLSKLREDLETAVIPFIFLGASSAREYVRYGMELGADDYLIKPCSEEEVLRAISTQLNKRATLKRWYVESTQTQVGSEESAKEYYISSESSIFPQKLKLRPICAFIEANFHKSISLADVAEATGYAPSYMTHLVKRQTQRSVYCWIIERRMLEARKLLLEDFLSVKEIASRIGYSDPGHFTRQFKNHHKMSPKAWQREHVILTML